MANILTNFQLLQQEAANETTPLPRLQRLATVSKELARIVALNPSTSPEFLRKLGSCNDAITRKNVAANPNIPIDLLWNLGIQFPTQVIDNPIFSLLWLENPNLLQEIPTTTLVSLLKCETIPISILEQVANQSDEELQMAVTMNPQAPVTVLEKLIESKYSEVKQAAQLHINIAGEMNSGWNEAAREAISTTHIDCVNQRNIEKLACRGLISEWMIEKIERNPKNNDPHFIKIDSNTPIQVLEKWAQDENPYTRRAAAQCPITPSNLLEQLAQDKDFYVRQSVARNPNIPVNLLEQLAQAQDENVRSCVAENPNTPKHLLEQLAQAQPDYIRHSVARNPNIPINLLEQFVKDEKSSIRRSVAQNPNIPAHFLEQLALDKRTEVIQEVAKNPNISLHILKILFQYRKSTIRNLSIDLLNKLMQNSDLELINLVAEERHIPVNILQEALGFDTGYRREIFNHKTINDLIQTVEELVHAHYRCLIQFIAKNPATSVTVLKQLAQNKDNNIRMAVAENPKTPSNLLEQLAEDKDSQIREKIAKNHHTSSNTLEKLAQDGNSYVRRAVADNPNTPVNIFLKVGLCNGQNSAPCFLRFNLLLHPQLPAETLAKNWRSPAWVERYAVAQNPNTPVKALTALVKDANRIVRATAKANLQNRYQQS